MAGIGTALDDIGTFDRLALQDTPVHRLDARAKVAVTAAFIVTAASYGRHDIAAMTPLFMYPAVMIAVGRVPIVIIVRCILISSPFALLVGIFNPIFDRETVMHLGPVAVSGGMLSFLSIMLRFMLTISAALILIACTGYAAICYALGRIGMPRALIVQFLFLYRYLFVLASEAARMERAHSLRSGGRRMTAREWASLSGHLLLRAFDRGRRIHLAMSCRGFDGDMPIGRRGSFSRRDLLFTAGWCAFFALARFGDMPRLVGEAVIRAFA